jgi:hypothetical protein
MINDASVPPLNEENLECLRVELARIRRIAATHTWDGPFISLEYGKVPSCSVCRADASADYPCPGEFTTDPLIETVVVDAPEGVKDWYGSDGR